MMLRALLEESKRQLQTTVRERDDLGRQLRDALGHFQPGDSFAMQLLEDLEKGLEGKEITKAGREERRRAYYTAKKATIAGEALLRETAHDLCISRVRLGWYERQFQMDQENRFASVREGMEGRERTRQIQRDLKQLQKEMSERRKAEREASSRRYRGEDRDLSALVDTFAMAHGSDNRHPSVHEHPAEPSAAQLPAQRRSTLPTSSSRAPRLGSEYGSRGQRGPQQFIDEEAEEGEEGKEEEEEEGEERQSGQED
jgi:hypothetical protein